MLRLTDRDRPSSVRMSEVISALSYALDIVEGQPEGHAVRSCLIGMRLAQEIGLGAKERSALFYALLLKDLGCSSNAAKVCYLFGADERPVKADYKTTQWTSFVERARYVLRNVTPGGSFTTRLAQAARIAAAGDRTAKELVTIRCERGSQIASELGLPPETAQAIRNLDEHWDGKGHPDGLKGEEIPLAARILGLAQTVEVFARRDGEDTAMAVAEARRGTWFDPDLVDAFASVHRDASFWARYHEENVRRHAASLEPEDRVLQANDAMLDRICRAFGRVIDAKSPWTAQHSQGVSDVAVGIAEVLGMSAIDIQRLRRAGLLHDIGKLGVSNMILDKPGRLTEEEFEQMKLHPAYTLRILERASCFHDVAELAARHHEKLDGSGYHRGLGAAALTDADRVLAVADMYEALAARRPYRQDLEETEVFEILDRQSGTQLCPRAIEALKHFVTTSGFAPYAVAA